MAISDGTLSSNSKIVNVTVKDVPSLPSVPDKTFCEPGEQVEITATGSGGVLNWFESASSEVILHTGNTYSVNLTETSSYFVEEISINPKKSVGPTDNIFGEGGSHAGDYYLIFTAEKDLTIHSVKVYAIGSGDRKFVLKNNSDVELESKIINLADGESRAALNFNVPVGSGYQLGIEKIGGSNVNMYRTSEGANYPYEIDELVSITGSSANTEGYYYYCYDWEVQEVGEGCSGPRKEVKVVLDPCLSTEEIKEADKVGIYPNPASEMIHIALVKYTEIQHISLRSITGKMVFKSIGSINSIDISGYAKGAYFLQITTNENTIVKKVLIK